MRETAASNQWVWLSLKSALITSLSTEQTAYLVRGRGAIYWRVKMQITSAVALHVLHACLLSMNIHLEYYKLWTLTVWLLNVLPLAY
jgi:hypothetical protein